MSKTGFGAGGVAGVAGVAGAAADPVVIFAERSTRDATAAGGSTWTMML